MIKETSVQRQIVMFSATYTREIKGLASTFLKNHVEVSIETSKKTVDSIEQKFVYTDSEKKRGVISFLVGSNNWKQVLVFTKTKHGANKLAKQLDKEGITTAAIHGNKSQAARTRALKAFKDYDVQVLVATDIAARGIDIDQLPHVVNYELPNVPEDYVHRIGRTGRAGKSGTIYTLLTPSECKKLRPFQKVVNNVIEELAIPSISDVMGKKRALVFDKLLKGAQGTVKEEFVDAAKELVEAERATPVTPLYKDKGTKDPQLIKDFVFKCRNL